ncbi:MULTISPECIES: YggT family protein [unclassified Campylobacter]|uniref:YggT family protein n=1 Tax=unclassified Campylobacter TaxID=2593542 RepID=UPI001237BAC1|nr:MULTISPECIES: YggT family protein [unclassified Campylobacter]KAA6224995.1 YggT family protein [Campylobacter sp. LR196d]KAA6225317.1 YggT family protein [Campylobacter sp. LR286c]KAA6225564.1 YggT family protein [Campylobacter sp. LR185c]KAA6230442.1 YggT family protein [Campylobacter sp. LR291e]KAA6230532.1 YggT family protein [Campylobacter sp. LR264d]
MGVSLILSLVELLQIIINVYIFIFIAAALITWVNPDPYNPIVQILYKLTAPAYKLISFIPTRIGPVDIAPIIIIIALEFIKIFIGQLAIYYLRTF